MLKCNKNLHLEAFQSSWGCGLRGGTRLWTSRDGTCVPVLRPVSPPGRGGTVRGEWERREPGGLEGVVVLVPVLHRVQRLLSLVQVPGRSVSTRARVV